METKEIIFYPISQAPKDGTEILLLDMDGKFAVVGSYCEDRGLMGWYELEEDGLLTMILATHFAYLQEEATP